MAPTVILNQEEIETLNLQAPSTANDGGYQNFMIQLQSKLDCTTNELTLSDNDLSRISKYAYDYGQGGWQNRLEAIFSRTLGPRLGRIDDS